MNLLKWFTIALLILSASCNTTDNYQEPDEPLHVTETAVREEQGEQRFGIPVDSFVPIPGKIRANSSLSDLFLQYGISMTEIDALVKNSTSVFDVRKVRANADYTILADPDSTARLRYLIYEHDQVTSYIFSFNDSLNITPYSKEITGEIRYASGLIESSLWESVINAGMHATVAFKLSEIFAWTVDFFGLQTGDSYKVIYEELFIDGRSLGAGRIYGAEFNWAGKKTVAIPFIQDERESFFDPEGNSLRKAFLKAPLQFTRISSRFSSGRMHPILRIRRPHYGVDYAAPVGTPVLSIGDGRVTFAGTENGAGRLVRITHNSVYSTAYLHLSRFGPGIAAGKTVKQGEIIGYVGSSGLSTGPHLDFRFYRNGSPVDPLTVEAPSVEPVKEENLQRFNVSKSVVMSLLATF